jgi:transposase-like protein
LKRSKGRIEMDKIEKPKVEKPGMEDKKGRKGSGHTAEEKCRAVLSVWTERRKLGEVCRELGVTWTVLSQWQARAMEGMLLALQPRVPVEKGVALNPRLAVLLERKSKGGSMKGLERRLARLQGSPVSKPGESREVASEKKV